MITTVITTVSFHMPDEYMAMHNFEISNDMNKWKRTEDTQSVNFTKVDYYMTSTERIPNG